MGPSFTPLISQYQSAGMRVSSGGNEGYRLLVSKSRKVFIRIDKNADLQVRKPANSSQYKERSAGKKRKSMRLRFKSVETGFGMCESSATGRVVRGPLGDRPRCND